LVLDYLFLVVGVFLHLSNLVLQKFVLDLFLVNLQLLLVEFLPQIGFFVF
jgi:hypothetical protein